jgi:hypothetical protein
MIEDEVKQELRDSLETHGLNVENFYLSSLTPIEGRPEDENKYNNNEPEIQRTAEEIKNERLISGNMPKEFSQRQ